MTEYIINPNIKACDYRFVTDTIRLGMENTKLLTNDELTEYVTDCLIHEYTHKILNDLFNNDVSKLFDAIEYLFRNDKLHEKTLIRRITYQTFIMKYGFERFLLKKQISKHDFIGANILCGIRKKTMSTLGGL